MKKYFYLFICFLCLGDLLAQNNWIPIKTDDFNQPSYGNVGKPVIQFSPNDILYTCYIDGINSNKCGVSKFVNDRWQKLPDTGFPETITKFSFVVDSNEVPYVLFVDATNGNKCTVKKFNGTAWVVVGSAGFSTYSVDEVSMAIGLNNVLYVGYNEAFLNYKCSVRKFNGAAWEVVGLESFSNSTTRDIDITVDDNNTPYISYIDNLVKGKVHKFNGSAWEVLDTSTLTETVGYMRLAVDHNNVPYIAFCDYTFASRCTVKKFNGTSWEVVGTQGFSAQDAFGRAYHQNLIIDHNNTPYIAYTDRYYRQLFVQKFDGTIWQTIGLPSPFGLFGGSIGFVADGEFLAVNNSNMLCLTHNSDNLFNIVLKYENNSWKYIEENNHSSIGGAYEKINLEIDPNNSIYTFGSQTNTTMPNTRDSFVAKYNESSNNWINLGVFFSGNTSVNTCKISVFDESNIYVAYNNPTSNVVVVRKFNGITWENLGDPNLTGRVGLKLTIKVDHNNTPYILYKDEATSNYLDHNLIVQKFNGTSWVTVGSFINSAQQYTNFYSIEIEFDSNNIPYIFSTDENRGNTFVKKLVGNNWVSLGSFVTNSQFGAFELDHNDVPYVVSTPGNQSAIVQKFNLTTQTWQYVGGQYISTDIHNVPDIKMDSNNIPYILISNATNNRKAKVLKFNGISWVNVDSPEISAGIASKNTLKIDSNNNLYVAYESNLAPFFKKYIQSPLSVPHSEFTNTSVSMYPNPSQNEITIKSEFPIEAVVIYDLIGNQVCKVRNSENKIVISSLSRGIYLVKVFVNGTSETLKLIKE